MARSVEAIRRRKDSRVLRAVNNKRRSKGQPVLKGANDLAELKRTWAARTQAKAALVVLELAANEARAQGSCMVAGCNRAHHAKGLCAKHYKQFRRQNGNGK